VVKRPSQAATPGYLALRNFIAWCGKSVAWLTVVMVLLTFTIVVLRYGFNLGWIWLQGHVRVDIFYAEMPEKKRALVDLFGSLVFLIPFCIFVLVIAWPYVANSWKLLEGSREAGGLPLVFLLKSLIMVLPALLLGQAFINVTDAWKTLRNEAPVENPAQR